MNRSRGGKYILRTHKISFLLEFIFNIYDHNVSFLVNLLRLVVIVVVVVVVVVVATST